MRKPLVTWIASHALLTMLMLTCAEVAQAELMEDVAPAVREAAKEKLLDADTLNGFLEPLVERAAEGPLSFLDDLELEFKWFNADEANGEDPGLGIAYHLSKGIQDWNLGDDRCGEHCNRIGADFDFYAKGNVAFDQSDNPEDFLDTKLSFSIFGSRGGAISQSDDYVLKHEALSDKLAMAPEPERPAVVREVRELVRDQFENQYFASLAAEISFESDQDFSERQLVYGARLGLDVKAWEDLYARNFGETNWLSRANIFDYPFATLRYITNSQDCSGAPGRCFIPDGTAIPIASLGIAAVDPEDDDQRQAAGGDLDPFPRFDVEVAFKTTAFTIANTNVIFSADYRFYYEIGADAAVEAADLDTFDYLAVTLGTENGPFVRYGYGQLPFDQSNQDVIEIGLKADFGALKDLLFSLRGKSNDDAS